MKQSTRFPNPHHLKLEDKDSGQKALPTGQILVGDAVERAALAGQAQALAKRLLPLDTLPLLEVQRQAEQFAAEQDRPTPAPMDAATHKDPGEPAEPVTPAVVREAIKTGVQATDRKPSVMKAELLAKIDEAVKDAPDYMDFQAVVKTMGLKDATAVFTDAKGTLGDKAAPQGYSRPTLRFKIEGDGVFTVNNTVRQLLTFRDKVEASPGFRDRQAPAGLNERATDTLDEVSVAPTAPSSSWLMAVPSSTCSTETSGPRAVVQSGSAPAGTRREPIPRSPTTRPMAPATSPSRVLTTVAR